MKKWISYILFISFCNTLFSQEMPVYNEYHLNKALINPAIIGSEGCTWIKGTDMHQWVGMSGAPQIQTLSVEASLRNRKLMRETDQRIQGLGAFLYRDVNGAYRTLGAQVSYAYHIYVSKSRDVKLGFGLSFRMMLASLNKAGFKGDYDPLINGGISTVIKPDAGAGLFLYSKKFYVGLSAGQLLNASYAVASERHYYLIAGYLTGTIRDRFRWLPAIALKTTEDLRKQVDLSLKMIVDDGWWLGLAYRQNLDKLPGQALSCLPMVGFTQGNIAAMYALNISTGKIQGYNYGTHEIMVAWRFCRVGYRCPVYQ